MARIIPSCLGLRAMILACCVVPAVLIAPRTAQATCSAISGSGLSFGTYTGFQLTPSTASLSLTCQAVALYAVGLNAGTSPGATVATRMMSNGANRLSYSLYQDSARSLNWGNTAGVDTRGGLALLTNPTVLTLYANLAAGLYPAPGVYTDTITATELNSAGVSTTFLVSATVQATCTIGATALAFGTYTGATLAANATITATCTSTTPYNVGLSAGNAAGASVTTRKMTGPGGALQPYGLFRDSAHTLNWGVTVNTDTLAGVGSGAAQFLTVYGQVAAAQSLTTPGSYSDIIVATLTY